MNETIDITEVDKVKLLEEMWKGVKPAAFFAMSGTFPPNFDRSKASEAVKNGYIDYFMGRCIKTDLSGDTINPRLYDRDAGQGTLSKIVKTLKK